MNVLKFILRIINRLLAGAKQNRSAPVPTTILIAEAVHFRNLIFHTDNNCVHNTIYNHGLALSPLIAESLLAGKQHFSSFPSPKTEKVLFLSQILLFLFSSPLGEGARRAGEVGEGARTNGQRPKGVNGRMRFHGKEAIIPKVVLSYFLSSRQKDREVRAMKVGKLTLLLTNFLLSNSEEYKP